MPTLLTSDRPPVGPADRASGLPLDECALDLSAYDENNLPYDDNISMDSHRQYLQIRLLTESAEEALKGRDDANVMGDMFLYFSAEQVMGKDFRGPDVMVALGVPNRERKSWVVWKEGKPPDVVIEVLSDSTAVDDRTVKKQAYQDQAKVPEYFWYHPFTGEFAGFRLAAERYRAIEPDQSGRLYSVGLGMSLGPYECTYGGIRTRWLRWFAPDGTVMPTPAEAERQRAETERQRAETERQRAETERQRAATERQRTDVLAARLRALGIDPDNIGNSS